MILTTTLFIYKYLDSKCRILCQRCAGIEHPNMLSNVVTKNGDINNKNKSKKITELI